MSYLQEIARYYDLCHKDYKLIWHVDICMAMHFGYWDSGTKNLKAALCRINEVLAEKARIKKTDCILDAGCGVGGSAIFLAKNYGCHVTGITLSEKQKNIALENARKNKVSESVNFKIDDYSNTGFKDGSFDVVWGLESICYAESKNNFINEAFRILKPNGGIIIADGFAAKNNFSASERDLMNKSFNGWAVKSLENYQRFKKYLKEAGFKNIEMIDMTENAMPSSRRLYICSFPAFAVNFIGKIFKRRGKVEMGNTIAAHYQYKTLKSGLWKYLIFYAKK